MEATLISVCVTATAAFVYILVARASRCPGPLRWRVRRWVWCGGLMGVLYLWATVVAARKLGVVLTSGLFIAGQAVTRCAFDTFGFLNLPIHTASVPRIVGVILIVAGVAIMALVK